MFRYYLKLGVLSIRANPALSALMVAAIAIGIGACMTMATVRHVMSDNPVAQRMMCCFTCKSTAGIPTTRTMSPMSHPSS